MGGGGFNPVKSVVNAAKGVASNPLSAKNWADMGLATSTGGLVKSDQILNAAGFQTQAPMAGVDSSGKPIRPGFQTLLGVDDKTGKYNRFSLPKELQANSVVGDKGRGMLADRATASGRSDLAKAQIQAQGLEEANALAGVAKQGGTQLAQAKGNLARSGGLRSGVAALMQTRNMQDQMLQKQNVRRGGIQDRLSIDMNDANQKNALLQNLVGQDLTSQQYNIGNVLGEKRTKDTADMSAYAQDMQAWAAGKQGQAIANSAPKGFLSFLGI